MTVISGNVQLMAESDDREQRHGYSEEILKQFDVLVGMQREVLDFARGERSIFVRRVYLNKFFADLAKQIRLELDGTPIELKLDVDSKLVGRFDEARLARAIHNLARNAMEAMGEGGGRLTIKARLEGSDLTIGVSDTGPGVPKEIQGRLFQSFVTAGKENGTGLGLAIVKKIVEEHGGSVSFRSTTRGTTFVLRLPQAANPERPTEPSSRRGPRSSPRNPAAKPE
jgi:signal transduction histidine kinase